MTRCGVLLVVAATAVALGGCGDDRQDVGIVEASVWPDSNLVGLSVSSCNADPTVEILVENDREVRLRARAGESQDDCADGVRVCLAEPLAGRTRIDETTGETIPVIELHDVAVPQCGTPVGSG